jgi:YihY family inner membrane protein
MERSHTTTDRDAMLSTPALRPPIEGSVVAQVSSAPSRHGSPWEARKQTLLDFWTKCANDWIFNFSGLLAYTLLMSIFPLFLVLLAIAGLSLGRLSPDALDSLASSLVATLPGKTGGEIVRAVLTNLRKSTGWLFALGLLLALFTGSRLFITIESSLSMIFRLRPRDTVHQNIMAFLMVLLYVVLVPIHFLASSASDALAHALFPGGTNAALVRLVGIASAFVVAVLLFGAIYVVVPNRPVQVKEVWKGTLVGAGLLVLYELLFPLYQNVFLNPGNYGPLAGFAIVILVFFYYFAFILLLGAEIHELTSRQRQTASDLASIIHEVQAHNTTRGAAGPTAGTPTEDLQHHEGAATVATDAAASEHERKEHRDDAQPPKYEEAAAPDPGQSGAAGPASDSETTSADKRSQGGEQRER